MPETPWKLARTRKVKAGFKADIFSNTDDYISRWELDGEVVAYSPTGDPLDHERAFKVLALITSEPSNLWMSGVSLLFTREFFELAADRLGQRGVLCQWLHLYQVGPDDVRTLVRTMSGPFPHMLAFGDGSDLLLVASRSPLVLDPGVWQRRLATNPHATSALARSGIRTGIDLAGGFLTDERGLSAWAGEAPLHTDDHPVLEFTAARRMASDWSEPIRAAMVRAGEAAGPIQLGEAGFIGST